MASVIQELRNLFADTGKPAEVNADGEFDTKTFNRFVAQQGIAVRFKQGRQEFGNDRRCDEQLQKDAEKDDARPKHKRMGEADN